MICQILSFWLLLLFHQTITIDAEKQIENNNNVNVNVNASSINTTNQTSITATASSSTTAAANSTNSTFTSKTSSSSSSSNNDNNDDYKQELINFQDDNNINHSYHFHHDFDEQKLVNNNNKNNYNYYNYNYYDNNNNNNNITKFRMKSSINPSSITTATSAYPFTNIHSVTPNVISLSRKSPPRISRMKSINSNNNNHNHNHRSWKRNNNINYNPYNASNRPHNSVHNDHNKLITNNNRFNHNYHNHYPASFYPIASSSSSSSKNSYPIINHKINNANIVRYIPSPPPPPPSPPKLSPLSRFRHIHRPSSSLSFIDRRKDVRGKFVSQIVNRASQAFQNLLEHRRNRSRPRLVKLMTERRSSVGRRLLPRVREHLAQHFESFRPKTLLSPPPSPPPPPPPEPLPQLSEQLVEEDLPLPNDIQFAESRIDGNETSSNRHDNNVWNIYDHQQQPQNHHHHQLLQTFPEPQINYEIEGQKLRQDIVNKVGNLQTILETAFHVTRQRRDQFLSRLLQNTNNRLERAKNRADQILSEPVTSELAVRTLHHINQGINNANLFLYNLLNRIDVSIKVQMKNSPQTPAAAAAAATTTTTTLPANISSNENGSNKNNGTATTTTTSH